MKNTTMITGAKDSDAIHGMNKTGGGEDAGRSGRRKVEREESEQRRGRKKKDNKE